VSSSVVEEVGYSIKEGI